METIAGDREAPAGIRAENRIRPAAPGRAPLRDLWRWRVLAVAIVLLIVVAPVVGLGLALRAMSSQQRSVDGFRTQVQALQAKVDAQPDWTAIARKVEPSVFTIETSYGLGSGWVARAGPAGSELVTNFHVIADAWNAGTVTVDIRQGDRNLKGTIARVDPNDDLAVIHVAQMLPILRTAPVRPVLAISPGNSGGPVVDARGRVVAVASAKFEGSGVEALSLGIPVQTACSAVVACLSSPD